MTTTTTRRATTKETAAALRSELRRSFPGVAFSVTMDRGTAYGWLSVRWTDGPAYDVVRGICDRYESSRFDGMDDGYHATGNSQWSCCGVICERSYSAGAMSWAVGLIERTTDGEMYINHDGAHAFQHAPWAEPAQVARQWLQLVPVDPRTIATDPPAGRRFADDIATTPSAPARRAI